MKIYKQNETDALAEILKRDGVISVPTDTVYGVCARINSIKVHNNLMSIKNRPINKLFPIMCADETLILGSRNFKDNNVPVRSSMGNTVTSAVFKILYGEKISDTQTGLRGIPSKYVENFINIPGNRYEYETNMLIDCILKKIQMLEISITTVYIDNNSDSHFNPIKDSILIYWKIWNSFIKYSIASIISFILDIIVFKILVSNISGLKSILVATIFARILSSIVNYTLNKKVTFKSDKKFSTTILKYYSLCIIQMLALATMVTLIFNLTRNSETLIKVIVDTILFLINFRVQRKWIFNE